GPLGRAIRDDRIPSMILWGTPGIGKTTLAQVIAGVSKAEYVPFSAVLGGIPELRKIVAAAKEKRSFYGTRTILFVDEIHRFNRAQQDALLPHVEAGTVTLIGATTENPSFSVNAALLSRARVFRLEPITPASMVTLLNRCLTDRERGLGDLAVTIGQEALLAIAEGAQGDARRALNALELVANHGAETGEDIDADFVARALDKAPLLYDKSGEEHYNVTSAFIKSMRGTDPDAAIYWMMRMLEAGEDPLFILRRMIIFASEDIGNADPRALEIAVAADQAFQRLGLPEGTFALAQCCLYLACAPKSNASYKAWTAAQGDVEQRGPLPVPARLRNAATPAMKEWGYGAGYRYPHDEGGYAKGETYLPDGLGGRTYYTPTEQGLEARIGQHLERMRKGTPRR
ncbi:MAG: replication-associated recombination protein A, partial [Myxococcales bacterium]|nr:replication-associated recombination protein A [Myxococcales bacterium]